MAAWLLRLLRAGHGDRGRERLVRTRRRARVEVPVVSCVPVGQLAAVRDLLRARVEGGWAPPGTGGDDLRRPHREKGVRPPVPLRAHRVLLPVAWRVRTA